MTFGDYLRNKREAFGWTQPEAALKAGIEQSYLSKLETGKSIPSEEVFSRLVTAYDLDLNEMTETLSEPELARLKEIGAIRKLVLKTHAQDREMTRDWMLAGLTCMMVGAASLGVAVLSNGQNQTIYSYTSLGVLEKGEPLDAFNIVDTSFSGTGEARVIFEEQKTKMTRRLDQARVETNDNHGSWFVRDVREGIRIYELVGKAEASSLGGWFLIPAFALLAGSFGCFLIGFGWK